MGIHAIARLPSLRICNPFWDSRSFRGHLEVKSSKLYSSKVMGIHAIARRSSLRICNPFWDSRSFWGHLKVKSSKLYSSNVMGIHATARRFFLFFFVFSIVLEYEINLLKVCFLSFSTLFHYAHIQLLEAIICWFWPLMTSHGLKRSVTPKVNMNPTYLPLEVSKNI